MTIEPIKMKNMDYKEEYKRALSTAKMWYRNTAMPDNVKEILSRIFPELKESEDKKIRKWLEEHIEAMPDNSIEFKDVKRIGVLHWLEEQGEKKPCDERLRKTTISFLKDFAKQGYENAIECIDWLESLAPKPKGKTALEAIREEMVDNANKVEPKFKVGQWIVWKDKYYRVNYNGCGYELVDQNGLSTSLEYGTIDENAHIWNITKDAKDGDILTDDYDKRPFIFKGLIDPAHSNCPVAYCGIDSTHVFKTSSGEHWWTDFNVKPATKTQRDFLFSKMKEAGYEWEADNKQLIKL